MKTMFTLALIGFALLMCERSAFACGCPTVGGFTREQEVQGIVNRAGTAVFTGKLTEITDRSTYREVTFTVDQYWSGKVTQRFTIRTERTKSSCAFGFQIDKSYLVFAETYKGHLYTAECSRNQLVDKAMEDLGYLGEGLKPAEDKDSTGNDRK